MSEIPTYCFFVQFPGFKDVFQVFGDGAAPLVKEYTNQFLRQPDGFIRHTNFDSVFASLLGKDQELSRAVPNLEFFIRTHACLFLKGELCHKATP
jgi:hypothetical protein